MIWWGLTGKSIRRISHFLYPTVLSWRWWLHYKSSKSNSGNIFVKLKCHREKTFQIPSNRKFVSSIYLSSCSTEEKCVCINIRLSSLVNFIQLCQIKWVIQTRWQISFSLYRWKSNIYQTKRKTWQRWCNLTWKCRKFSGAHFINWLVNKKKPLLKWYFIVIISINYIGRNQIMNWTFRTS